MNDRQIRFGIIGAGEILQHMKRAFQGNPKACAVAVADPNHSAAAAIAGELKATALSDYRDLLSDPSVEAVYIATPPFLHKQMLLDAIAAGKHVICEKPLAMNSLEVREIAHAAAGTRLKVSCCSCRFLKTPAAVAARQMICDNQLGVLRTLTLIAATPGIPGPKSWAGWKAQKKCAGGGLVMDWGVYDLDWMFDVLGASFRPHQVFATTRDFCGDVESSFAVTILCEDGLRVDWQRRNVETGPARKSSIEIRGASAGLDLSMIPSDIPTTLYTMPAGTLEHRQIAPAFSDWAPCLVLPIQDFAESILEDRPPLSDPARQLQIHQIIDAIYQSVDAAEVVRI